MKFDAYRRYFRPALFWQRMATYARTAGTQTVYAALLLYYAYERKETPKWAKRVVLGALGYLLMPFDAVPDLTPILGYTDDIGVLGLGLATIAVYVNTDVKHRARKKLSTWLPDASNNDLEKVEKRLED